MFGFMKSLDVTKTHSVTDAVWFYITGLIMMIGFTTVLGYVLSSVGMVEKVGSFFDGGHTYTLLGTGFVLLLSSMILTGRKLTGDLFSILLVGVAVYLAFTTSLILGLVPVALLTTLHGSKEKE
jgi:hypothetical protein